MKYTKTVLVLLCFLAANWMQAQDSNVYYYTVHVGAFDHSQQSDFNTIQSLGYMYAQKEKGNVTRIFMGGYPTEGNAYQTLNQVKANGFPDAFVTRKQIFPENDIYAIYLATANVGDNIDWKDYNRAGKLYTAIRGNQIDIYASQYPTEPEAKSILTAVKKIGFNNAQTIKINKAHLQAVTEFQAGIPIKNIVLAPVEQVIEVQEELAEKGSVAPKKGPNLMVNKKEPAPVVATPVVTTPTTTTTGTTTTDVPKNYEIERGRIVAEAADEPVVTSIENTPEGEVVTIEIPKEKETVVITEKSGSAVEKPAMNPVALPTIRTTVKRTSVLDLQKILKANNYYTSSLDGWYGKGTAAGWDKMLASNDFFQKLTAYQSCNVPVLQAKGGGINSVDHLFDWEELNMLRRVTEAISAITPNQQVLDLAATERAALLMSPKALTADESAAVVAWNKNFWSEVETWSNKAAILKKWSLPLKASYLQSQVRLEDYFMNKGMSSKDATGLAILTLKTMVEPWLDFK